MKERFYVHNEFVYDRVNRKNNRIARENVHCPLETLNEMRKAILTERVRRLFAQVLPPNLKEDDAFSGADFSLTGIVELAGFASRNTTPKRKIKTKIKAVRERDLHEVTTIGQFLDDLEAIVLDLYGNIDNAPRAAFRHGVIQMLEFILSGRAKPIFQEYDDAHTVWGYGRIPGYGVHNVDLCAEAEASRRLTKRVAGIRANPMKHGRYSIAFAEKAKEYENEDPDTETYEEETVYQI